MLNQPLVSIIIPTYNRAPLIGETLDSVLAQIYTNWECIVVDDGSTDATDTIVSSYCEKDSRFQYCHRPSNRLKGANACRNYGFEKSKGGFILFLDSDDLLKNVCLENRIGTFKKFKNLDFVIANTSYYKDKKFSDVPMCEFPERYSSINYLKLFLSYRIPWTVMSVLWKRETIIQTKFKEQLKRFQDVDFHINVLLNKDLKNYRIEAIDTFYRIDDAKPYSSEIIDVVLNSLLEFNKSNMKIVETPIYKSCLRRFNYKIIFEYVIPYFYANRKSSNKLILWYLSSKLYSFKQKIAFLNLFFLLNTRLFLMNGIGIYKFNLLFKNIISKNSFNEKSLFEN